MKKTKQPHSRFSIRRQTGVGAGTAEFAPALMVFFLFMLFPLLDLMAVAMGAASVNFLAKQALSRAGTATTYGQAVQLCNTESQNIQQSGIGRFLNLQPVGSPSGITLSVVVTTLTGNNSSATTYNGTVPAANLTADQIQNSTYEYTGLANFQVGPMVSMHAMPGLGSVPGLGVPFVLQTVAASAVEHPEGLSDNSIPPASN